MASRLRSPRWIQWMRQRYYHLFKPPVRVVWENARQPILKELAIRRRLHRNELYFQRKKASLVEQLERDQIRANRESSPVPNATPVWERVYELDKEMMARDLKIRRREKLGRVQRDLFYRLVDLSVDRGVKIGWRPNARMIRARNIISKIRHEEWKIRVTLAYKYGVSVDFRQRPPEYADFEKWLGTFSGPYLSYAASRVKAHQPAFPSDAPKSLQRLGGYFTELARELHSVSKAVRMLEKQERVFDQLYDAYRRRVSIPIPHLMQGKKRGRKSIEDNITPAPSENYSGDEPHSTPQPEKKFEMEVRIYGRPRKEEKPKE